MTTNSFQPRVLLVDDDPNILDTLSAILEGEGFSVRVAEDGFAALKTLRDSPSPDLIISDLRMPNMSGFELLSIVRKRFPDIPVIATSAEFLAEGMPTGLLADVFLQKGGYKIPRLVSTIRRLVSESPIRPHPLKYQKAPLWIPRRETGYIVVTCTDCLRSFPVDDSSTGNEVHVTDCPCCETKIEYIVESAVLDMLKSRAMSKGKEDV